MSVGGDRGGPENRMQTGRGVAVEVTVDSIAYFMLHST